ncbi:hypothetical protein SEUCBS140593_003560 [Sporothrix eucalyptigena]|uniref:Major facilitator superfamily (MFS) profile domain-containing protein n=1 Tax=Sporothrix eucalyptigena TaxID=1812306 RepID=A0ABP0BFW2_9PEZI
MALKDRIRGRLLVALVTVATSCAFLLFGYNNGVFSGIIVSPWFLATFDNPASKKLAIISAIYNLGGFAGSLIAFFVGAKLGRRRTTLSGIAICIVGGIVQGVATQLGELIAGRVVCGVGVGVMTSTVGIWQAEITPSRSRGAFLSIQVGTLAGGLFLAQWINYGFHATAIRVAYVFPVCFQLIFPTVAALLILVLPESPRWLMKQGRREEAEAVLTRMLGSRGTPADVAQRLASIEEVVTLEQQSGENPYRALFTMGPAQNGRRLMLACGVLIMHQLGGSNSVTYYLPTLTVTFLGVSHVESLWIAGLSSLASVIFAIVPVLTIDRLGRRVFLWGGCAFQAVMFIIVAVLLAEEEKHPLEKHTFGVAAVVFVFLFYCGYAMTWLAPSWVYPTEVLPLQIREKGLALGNVLYWLFQFMIVEITPIALTNIQYRFYIILAIFNVCGCVLVFFFLPETKGLTLEEMDFYFAKKYGFDVPEGHQLDSKVVEQPETVEHA